MNRADLLSRASGQGAWDVIVVGGGATGLGAAVDAAARGYSTLLLEQSDFGLEGLVFAAGLLVVVVAGQDLERRGRALHARRLRRRHRASAPARRWQALGAQLYQPSSLAASVRLVSQGKTLKRPQQNGSLPVSTSTGSVESAQVTPLRRAAARRASLV